MITVCFIGTQIQDTLNLKYIYEGLKGDFQFDAFFLNMDGVYHQNTVSLLPNSHVIDFGVKLKQPFYRLSLWKKLAFYIILIAKRNKMPKSDMIVFGNLGAVEFLLAKYAQRKYRSRIYLIKDSILLLPESTNKIKKLTNRIYGKEPRENICDKIFVSGEATKLTMMKDGVHSSKVIPTGLPRYETIFNSIVVGTKKNKDDKFTILLLTSAYDWHRDFEHSQLQKKYMKELVHKIHPNGLFKILFKIHPRDEFADYDFLKYYPSVEVHHDTNAFDLVQLSDIVFSFYYPSTLLFESMHLGKKVLILDHGFNYNLLTTPVEFDKIVKVVYSVDEAAEYFELEERKRQMCDDWNFPFGEFFITQKSSYATQEIISHIKNIYSDN